MKSILFSVMFSLSSLAQAAVVVVPQISGKYSARIQINQCDKYACKGSARVSLFSLETHEKIVEIESEDFSISVSRNSNSNEESFTATDDGDIVIGDFNFDGHDDVAIQNGHNGSYGYASYDVYTYDAKRQVYSLNLELTRLTGGEYLGMFHVDKKRRRLLAYNKAADRAFSSFEFISDVRGVRKTCEKSEIWDMSDSLVKVTVKTLEHNKWLTRERSFSDDLYDFNKMAARGRCAFLNQ
ncbi:XAC2610-related protein [Herbaspirillum robiniae]|uniref:VCBS repeat-containing protein n=1 Tax=Herbaspirillum robiniae TaxID=2014887 RepID=A0A246WR17_9BURK|nr:hypothetical protein [Herbaspirillum robiniae]OWY28814.1 hypothetical protein CEJ42_12625 [Herbaspirillum robiniae]